MNPEGAMQVELGRHIEKPRELSSEVRKTRQCMSSLMLRLDLEEVSDKGRWSRR